MNINFKYVGYPYFALDYSEYPVEREIELFNTLGSETITIELDATVTTCYYGTTAGTFVPADAKCTVGGTDYFLWE